MSYDPDLFQNPKAKIIEIQSSLNPASCMAVSLHPCVSASTTSSASCIPAPTTSLHPLHNKNDNVLANITARNDAKKAFSENYPRLVDFYAKFIELRFNARAHARNKFIVQAVPILNRAVAPENVLALVGHFYDCNRALFNDPREQHMKEAKAMLESVTKTYPKTLNAREREVYQALPEDEKNAFRICRDLALLKTEKRKPLTFYLSCNHLGDRLGLYSMEAQRILWQLENYGLIKLLQKGTRRTAGVRGLAGLYQWLISP